MSVGRLPRLAGHQLLSTASLEGRMSLFWADTMAKCITPRFYLAETVRQVYSIGVKSLLLTSTVAVSVGIVMSMQTLGTLESFGATNYVAVVVGLAMVKELGPVLTAIMVAGRAGSGISAELGSMRVTRQIDALTVSAVNPMRYLVVTRVMACMVAVPLLTIIADVVGIIGGMVIVVLEGHMGGHLYLSYTVRFVALRDVIPGLLKTVPFGLLIGLVASFYGFHTQGGTEGVGNATKSSVVTSALLIILSDVIFTRLLLGIFGR